MAWPSSEICQTEAGRSQRGLVGAGDVDARNAAVPVWRGTGPFCILHLCFPMCFVALSAVLLLLGERPFGERSVRIRSRDASVVCLCPWGTSGACREVPRGTCPPVLRIHGTRRCRRAGRGAPQGPGSPPPTRGRQGQKRHRNLPAFPPGLAHGAFSLESPETVCGRAPNGQANSTRESLDFVSRLAERAIRCFSHRCLPVGCDEGLRNGPV